MTRRRKRLALSGVSALVLVAVATALAVLSAGGGSSQAAPGELETPPALAAHLAKLKQALPGNQGMALEGPGSAAAAEYAHRSYPAPAISVSEMSTAASSANRQSTRFFRGQGRRGQWVFAGPSEALYPLERFRNASNYVPNAYVAGHRRHVYEQVQGVHQRCRWRNLAYEGHLREQRQLGLPGWSARDQLDGSHLVRPERRDAQDDLRRHR